ncbi:MAG TPA: cell division protein SepF [Candidatus Binatia bacterium]|nr:cell division protein SepF [Candidatus Binatia bacterium]
MSMFGKLGSFFALREDEDEFYEEDSRGNVVPLSAERRGTRGTEVGVFLPKTFADVTDIADALRARQVVIINLQGADRALLQRVVDFTSGVAYTIDGKIQKLAEAIYLVVPAGVNVNSAGLRESLDTDAMLDFSRTSATKATGRG